MCETRMNRDPHDRSQCTLAESLTSIVLPISAATFCVADLGESPSCKSVDPGCTKLVEKQKSGSRPAFVLDGWKGLNFFPLAF